MKTEQKTKIQELKERLTLEEAHTIKIKIEDKIQKLRQSLCSADAFVIKNLATSIRALEGFLNSFRAYGIDAVAKESPETLKELVGIDDNLEIAVQERLYIYSTLPDNMKNAILEEIKAVFLSHQDIDFTDATQMPLLDLKHEELLSLRCYLRDMEFKTWRAWLDSLDRLDKELIRRCIKRLPTEQQTILGRLL